MEALCCTTSAAPRPLPGCAEIMEARRPQGGLVLEHLERWASAAALPSSAWGAAPPKSTPSRSLKYFENFLKKLD